MKKMIGSVVAVVAVASAVLAADITQVASYDMSEGKRVEAVKDLVVTDVPTLISAVNALDQLAGVVVETGTATNAQTVTFTSTFSAAPAVVFNSGNGTNVAYAASVTTTNFVAAMKAGETNKWIAILVP